MMTYTAGVHMVYSIVHAGYRIHVELFEAIGKHLFYGINVFTLNEYSLVANGVASPICLWLSVQTKKGLWTVKLEGMVTGLALFFPRMMNCSVISLLTVCIRGCT